MKSKKNKQYTLTFFICMENGDEILETIDADNWFEVIEESIIYCINETEDIITCYLKNNLRRVVQHYSVPNSKEEITHEKPPEGYN